MGDIPVSTQAYGAGTDGEVVVTGGYDDGSMLMGAYDYTANVVRPVRADNLGDTYIRGVNSDGSVPVGDTASAIHLHSDHSLLVGGAQGGLHVNSDGSLRTGGYNASYYTDSTNRLVITGTGTDSSVPVCGTAGLAFTQHPYAVNSPSLWAGAMLIAGCNTDRSISVGGTHYSAFSQNSGTYELDGKVPDCCLTIGSQRQAIYQCQETSTTDVEIANEAHHGCIGVTNYLRVLASNPNRWAVQQCYNAANYHKAMVIRTGD